MGTEPWYSSSLDQCAYHYSIQIKISGELKTFLFKYPVKIQSLWLGDWCHSGELFVVTFYIRFSHLIYKSITITAMIMEYIPIYNAYNKHH